MDILTAKNNLAGHTICLCKDGICLYSEKRGIAPMIEFIEKGYNLFGYSVADKVVGKAVALLFVKCGIVSVYAENLSESGKEVLQSNGIAVGYKTLTQKIINRTGTDICPMEKAVSDCSDPEKAYILLKAKLEELSGGRR